MARPPNSNGEAPLQLGLHTQAAIQWSHEDAIESPRAAIQATQGRWGWGVWEREGGRKERGDARPPPGSPLWRGPRPGLVAGGGSGKASEGIGRHRKASEGIGRHRKESHLLGSGEEERPVLLRQLHRDGGDRALFASRRTRCHRARHVGLLHAYACREPGWGQMQSEAIRSNQKRSEAIRSNHACREPGWGQPCAREESEGCRRRPKAAEGIMRHQKASEGISEGSEAIRRTPKATEGNRRHLKAPEGIS